MSFQERKRKIIKDAGGKAFWTLEKLIARTSKIDNTPYFESNLFDWIERLEKKQPVIRDELDGILEYLEQISNFQQISKGQKSIISDNKRKPISCMVLAINQNETVPMSGGYEA